MLWVNTPGKIIYDLLRERGVDCILAVPNIESKEEYLEDALLREGIIKPIK